MQNESLEGDQRCDEDDGRKKDVDKASFSRLLSHGDEADDDDKSPKDMIDVGHGPIKLEEAGGKHEKSSCEDGKGNVPWQRNTPKRRSD